MGEINDPRIIKENNEEYQTDVESARRGAFCFVEWCHAAAVRSRGRNRAEPSIVHSSESSSSSGPGPRLVARDVPLEVEAWREFARERPRRRRRSSAACSRASCARNSPSTHGLGYSWSSGRWNHKRAQLSRSASQLRIRLFLREAGGGGA